MSTPVWAPDHPIDLGLAARTIADQFPELSGHPVRRIGEGWDNAVFGVGEAWVFRFIHRSTALEGSAAELAVLAALPDDLPLPIPRPRFIGTPTSEVPWPFWGAPLLPGSEIAEADLPDDARTGVAGAVGAFLARLHDPALAARVVAATAGRGVTLRVDPWSRASPVDIVPRARRTLDRLRSAGTMPPDQTVDRLLADAARLGSPDGEPVVVHGDLHVRHLLVSDGAPSGVIDWGDAGLGDPAIDLMIAFQAFAGAARDAFRDAYGPIGVDTELRARALAVHIAAALTEQATADGMASVAREACAALTRAAR